LHREFGNRLVSWLESRQNSFTIANAQRELARSALSLLRRSSGVAYPFLRTCTDFLKHLDDDVEKDLDGILHSGEKISEISLFLFHISTAGSIRGTQAVQMKIFNEAFRSSMDLDSLRNLYIYQG
jgi:hypothetical protein